MILELDNAFDIVASLKLLRFSLVVQFVFSLVFIVFSTFYAHFEVQIAVGIVSFDARLFRCTFRLFRTEFLIFLKLVDFDACFLLLLCFLSLKFI